VGLFTSPHLARWEERIRIDGVIIDDELLANAGGRVIQALPLLGAARTAVTRFELWTALACEAFALAACDVAVLEVGLGGRYDATTAADADLVVITRIALDHTAILGPTLADVAREKAAIIRSAAPVVSAPQAREAGEIVIARAAELRAPLLMGDVDVLWTRGGGRLAVLVREHDIADIHVGLRGPHQDENAATAVAAALSLDGVAVSDHAVRHGISTVRWPARFEVARDAVVDGAHNPDGARALAVALRDAFPGERFSFVLGVMSDKDLDGMLAELAPLAERIVAVRSASPRARSAEEIADASFARGVRSDVAPTVAAAIAAARSEGSRVVVAGSLALAAEARTALGLGD
jgi:dihydrofolate synthase/folylpolyglutamate synthase